MTISVKQTLFSIVTFKEAIIMLTLEQAKFIIRHEREKISFLQYLLGDYINDDAFEWSEEVHKMNYPESGYLEVTTSDIVIASLSLLFDYVRLAHLRGDAPKIAVIANTFTHFSISQELIFRKLAGCDDFLRVPDTQSNEFKRFHNKNLGMTFICMDDSEGVERRLRGMKYNVILSLDRHPSTFMQFAAKSALAVFIKRDMRFLTQSQFQFLTFKTKFFTGSQV